MAHSLRCFPLLMWLCLACDSGSSPSVPDPPELPPSEPLFDRIIFARPSPPECGCGFGLWTIAPDGSDLRLLRDSLQYPESPNVSPDGRSVVFEDAVQLFTMRSDGLDLRHIPTGMYWNVAPIWSPDGQWILFAEQATRNRIFRIRPDGTQLEALDSTPGVFSDYPRISRDGRYLAYTAIDSASTSHRWVVIRDLLTQQNRVVTDSVFPGRQGEWLPDGSGLLFLDGLPDPPPFGFALWRLALAPSTYTYFGDSKGNRPATASPDGRTLLFGSGDLWLSDADGTNLRPLLADSVLNQEAFWTPAAP